MSTDTTNTTTNPDPATDGDLDVILPEPATLEVGGIPATVNRLRMRELMRFAGVVSAGLGPAMQSARPANGWSGADIGALVGLALPNAIDPFCEFLVNVVQAKDPARRGELAAYLGDNPEISDLLAVTGVLIQQERGNFGDLGKQLTAIFDLFTRTTTPAG